MYSIANHQSGYEQVRQSCIKGRFFEFNLLATVEMIGREAKKELDKAMAESVDFSAAFENEKTVR